jgi:hypothetical protein
MSTGEQLAALDQLIGQAQRAAYHDAALILTDVARRPRSVGALATIDPQIIRVVATALAGRIERAKETVSVAPASDIPRLARHLRSYADQLERLDRA